MSIFGQAALVMIAAVVAVPIFKRLGLGAVLGYLFAGVVVGPSALNVIGHVDEVLHIAELGVVFFLFLVGLELQPKRLWELRRSVFGLGAAQVIGSTLLIFGAGVAYGLSAPVALVAAMGLSLSSTAIALRLLADRGVSQGKAGQSGFAILLFQDLAVVPLLALIPIIAGEQSGSAADVAVGAVKVIAMVTALIVGGRLLIRPIFRLLGKTHVHEISTIVAILIVLGAGLAMTAVGLSMALGAFLAGVMLADSEYRHELEASIDPFKGILLGLFFMAIGMSANLEVARQSVVVVVGAVVVVVVFKTGLLYALLASLQGASRKERVQVAAALSQGGEFAFVLYGVAAEHHVLSPDIKDLLVVVVSLSMATTPLVLPLLERLIDRLFPAVKREQRAFDVVETEAPILIAGFGRFGQIVGRALIAGGHTFTALENNVEHVDFVRKFGNKIYYGDATHLELLRAAGIERAKALVIAVDDMATSIKIATIVKGSFPQLPMYVRVRNRAHAYAMLDMGIETIERETFHSSLRLAERLLGDLDADPAHANEVINGFERFDNEMLASAFTHHHDEAKLIQGAAQAFAELNTLFEAEAERRRQRRSGAGVADVNADADEGNAAKADGEGAGA
jgi:glutathione-regulated potassium-efflux system ancillary protein KefC/glutathione-regulated potassium-efflux system protein KefB